MNESIFLGAGSFISWTVTCFWFQFTVFILLCRWPGRSRCKTKWGRGWWPCSCQERGKCSTGLLHFMVYLVWRCLQGRCDDVRKLGNNDSNNSQTIKQWKMIIRSNLEEKHPRQYYYSADWRRSQCRVICHRPKVDSPSVIWGSWGICTRIHCSKHEMKYSHIVLLTIWSTECSGQESHIWWDLFLDNSMADTVHHKTACDTSDLLICLFVEKLIAYG